MKVRKPISGKRWTPILAHLPTPEGRTVAMTEVGVWAGKLSEQILLARPNIMLTLVDPWKASAPGEAWYESGSEMARKAQGVCDGHYAHVRDIALPYVGRAQILRTTSVDAAKEIADGSQDLVFIDAIHTYDAVKEDIAAWRGKVRPGGYLAGHDYAAPRFPGTQRAVDEAFPTGVETGVDHTWFVRMA